MQILLSKKLEQSREEGNVRGLLWVKREPQTRVLTYHPSPPN